MKIKINAGEGYTVTYQLSVKQFIQNLSPTSIFIAVISIALLISGICTFCKTPDFNRVPSDIILPLITLVTIFLVESSRYQRATILLLMKTLKDKYNEE